MRERRYHRPAGTGQAGATLIELLAVLAIMGIAMSIGALYLSSAEAPLQTGTTDLQGYFRQVRARAMATTSAYRVWPSSADRIQTEFASNCSAGAWTTETGLALDLPRGVGATDTTWTVCFNSRGQSAANVTVTLAHADFGSADVEVLLGGMVRVVQ